MDYDILAAIAQLAPGENHELQARTRHTPNMNPVMDYDILAAIAQLAPGENHELQASTRHTPAIVVQVCGNQELDLANFGGKPRQGHHGKIVQTRCPERQHSLED